MSHRNHTLGRLRMLAVDKSCLEQTLEVDLVAVSLVVFVVAVETMQVNPHRLPATMSEEVVAKQPQITQVQPPLRHFRAKVPRSVETL